MSASSNNFWEHCSRVPPLFAHMPTPCLWKIAPGKNIFCLTLTLRIQPIKSISCCFCVPVEIKGEAYFPHNIANIYLPLTSNMVVFSS